jgi:DNA-binding MarR family transcriptional regulator
MINERKLMKTKISHLEDHTGLWLRRVSNHVSLSFARKLTDMDTTVAEWALLRVLFGQNAVAPGEVAKQMGMTKGAISKLVDRLVGKSLVARSDNPRDGRAQHISLTEKGEKLVPELAALADQNDHECFSHLSDEEHETLQRILRSLASKLSIKSIPIQ